MSKQCQNNAKTMSKQCQNNAGNERLQGYTAPPIINVQCQNNGLPALKQCLYNVRTMFKLWLFNDKKQLD